PVVGANRQNDCVASCARALGYVLATREEREGGRACNRRFYVQDSAAKFRGRNRVAVARRAHGSATGAQARVGNRRSGAEDLLRRARSIPPQRWASARASRRRNRKW